MNIFEAARRKVIKRAVYQVGKPEGFKIVFSLFDDSTAEIVFLNNLGDLVAGGEGSVSAGSDFFRESKRLLAETGQEFFGDEEPIPIYVETAEELDRIPSLVQSAEHYVRTVYDSAKDPGIAPTVMCKKGQALNWVLVERMELSPSAHLIAEILKPEEMVVLSEAWIGHPPSQETPPGKVRDWPQELRSEGIIFTYGFQESPLDRAYLIPLLAGRVLGRFINLSHELGSGRLCRAIEGVRGLEDMEGLADLQQRGLVTLHQGTDPFSGKIIRLLKLQEVARSEPQGSGQRPRRLS